MAYSNLNQYITALEQAGELIRISHYVNPELEICEITDRFSKEPGGGKALLFENTGTEFPVITNAMGSLKRICMALGTDDLDTFGEEINDLLKLVTSENTSFLQKLKMLPLLGKISSWMPHKTDKLGKCQDIVIQNPDLSILPILKCWPADGGRFVTLPLVHTIDPITGIRNLGMYRMQVLDKNTTGMHWHRHKTGARHYAEYKRLGQIMPVAVALGGDPVYTWSATAPLPDQIDEYILAGFIRKKKVSLVKCVTQNIYIPSDVDIVIEGYVDPQEDLVWEGPFGDHTGFYSLEDWYPKFHVTCITHRKDAVYPATIVGIPPQEDAWIAKATERFFLAPIKLAMAPEIIDLDIPTAGTAHNLTILKIDKTYPGQGQKVMNSLWGAGQMMFNKYMVVVDKQVDIHNYQTLFPYLLSQLNISDDLLFGKGPLDVLDHAAEKFAFGSKLGFDLTTKFTEEHSEKENTEIIQKKIDYKVIKDLAKEIKDCIWYTPYALFISVDETSSTEINLLMEKLANASALKGLKVLVAFNTSVQLTDSYLCAWQAFSNTDPSRDCRIIHNVLTVDATIKTIHKNGFKRHWPNIVTSSVETIEKVNKNWEYYLKHPYITSPSEYYRRLIKGENAIVSESSK